jgi:streptogramin lyase
LPARAAVLPGYGELSGKVTGSKAGVLPVVYAYNTAKNVSYTVFVVNGKYRAVNLLPGPYDVTLRPAVNQLEGFAAQTIRLAVAADAKVTADFAIKGITRLKDYVGGFPYEACGRDQPDCGATILPYDKIYPPGPGRDIVERTCFGCHAVNFFSYNRARGFPGGRPPLDRDGWAITVDRMHKRDPGARLGAASYMDPALLPPKDRDTLVEYLAKNFGFNSEPRVVQLETVPPLNLAALEKAMFIEYIWKEDPAKYPTWPWSHNLTFDGEGNVWNAYTGCCIVRFDPRTGEAKAYEGNGGGSSIEVDRSDGTVWYSGDITSLNHGGSAPGAPMSIVKRLDPKTGLVDKWMGVPSNTQIFDAQGNLWMTQLGLVKLERSTNSLYRWDVPVVRSNPYGIIVDYDGKVWFADHYTSGITRFDPNTHKFTYFRLTQESPTNIRRPGVDSKNMIWAGAWASPLHRVKGRDVGGALFRLDPKTGKVMERRLGIEYAALYNADIDPQDNVWVAQDNYLSKYDQTADTFTHYPIPRRSETLKTAITRDGAVWFVYRNGGKFAGYGASSVVLYPDKDKITTLGAYFAENSPFALSAKYRGPKWPKVNGGNKFSLGSQNAAEYEQWAIANGLPGPEGKIGADKPNTDGDRY